MQWAAFIIGVCQGVRTPQTTRNDYVSEILFMEGVNFF